MDNDEKANTRNSRRAEEDTWTGTQVSGRHEEPEDEEDNIAWWNNRFHCVIRPTI